MTEKPHPLSVPLGTYDCRLIDLPKDYYRSIPKLVAHAKSVIADNERYHGRICEKFYIGKSFVRTWTGRKFDPHKPTTTWRKEGINNRWRARQEKGFDNMAVLAVFTNDSLPPLQSRRPALWKQQYTLAMEQALITHFMFVEDDQRLENETTNPGGLEGGSAVGYVLYLCMKFRDLENPVMTPSNEKATASAAVKDEDDSRNTLEQPLQGTTAATHPSADPWRRPITDPWNSKPFPATAAASGVPTSTQHTTTDRVWTTLTATALRAGIGVSPDKSNTFQRANGQPLPDSYHPTQGSTDGIATRLNTSSTSGATVPSRPMANGTVQPAVIEHETPPSTETGLSRVAKPSACRSLFQGASSTGPHPPLPSTPEPDPPPHVYPVTPSWANGVKPCKCGSTDHQRISHHTCPLRKPCKCGSTSHQRTNHNSCPLNPRNLLQLGTVQPAVIEHETPPSTETCLSREAKPSTCRSLFPSVSSTGPHPPLPSTPEPDPPPHVYPVTPSWANGVKPCKCGSTDHQRISHHTCPLRKPCKCGSTSHQRTNYSYCPLNPRNQ